MDIRDIDELRNQTGCSIFEARKAVELFGNNFDLCREYLRGYNTAVNRKGGTWLGHYVTELKNQLNLYKKENDAFKNGYGVNCENCTSRKVDDNERKY